MTQISSIILCAIVMINSNQTIVSGSFGVAWLNDDKVISVFDANSVTQPVPNIKVNAILAADVLEEGSEQLLFLDEAKKALHVYSFKTKMVLGPFGSNIKTFAAGRWSDKESFPSVFVNTFSGQAFRWTKEIMGKGWESVSGAFEKAASIKLKPNSRTDDFVVVADGMLYTFNTKWQTYSSQPEAGKNIVALLTGNVTGSPADDVVFFDKSGTVFLYNNQTVENLKQQVICLTLGKNGGDLDALYGLDKRGKPVIYDRSAKSWKSVPFQNAFYCTNIITRTNPDGKGHELFVVRNNDLYQITADGTVKQLSEQKQTKIVLTDGEKPLAEYRFANVPFKPYIDILRTPSGRNILRDAPYDHLHHHGLMFAIAVNGCNFWEEFTPRHGKEITVSIKPQPDTATSFLESELEWRNGESQTLIRESRKISVSGGNSAAGEKVTVLDWQTTLKAGEQGANLDKSSHHYYGLGLRFDETMDKSGRFFSDSEANKSEVIGRGDERLTPCGWMAYTAKLNGEPVTVAVFGHPTNPIPTMGFTMGDSGKSFAYLGITLNLHRQPVEMKPNSSLTFRYRIAVWDGEVTPETVAKLLPTLSPR